MIDLTFLDLIKVIAILLIILCFILPISIAMCTSCFLSTKYKEKIKYLTALTNTKTNYER